MGFRWGLGRVSPRRATGFLARARKSAKKACCAAYAVELALAPVSRLQALRSNSHGKLDGHITQNHFEESLEMVGAGGLLFSSTRLQRPAKSLVQQGLFQLIQRGDFALVKGFEGLGLFAQGIEL